MIDILSVNSQTHLRPALRQKNRDSMGMTQL
jgi:hypothetical protein